MRGQMSSSHISNKYESHNKKYHIKGRDATQQRSPHKKIKNPFIAILSGVDKRFPMHLWDRLLLQIEMTLDMLQVTNIKPWVSAKINLQGQHDYNKMPITPLGFHTMTHNKPERRTLWGPWASKGFYVSTSNKYYQCFWIWLKGTCSICTSDTVLFHHKSQIHHSTKTYKQEWHHNSGQKSHKSSTDNDTCLPQWTIYKYGHCHTRTEYQQNQKQLTSNSHNHNITTTMTTTKFAVQSPHHGWQSPRVNRKYTSQQQAHGTTKWSSTVLTSLCQ